MTTQSDPPPQPDTVRLAARRPIVSLRGLSLILVIIGLFVSGYLSYTRLSETSLVCVEAARFDCDLVQNSAYSKMFGVPVAYLGFATYLMLGALLLLEARVPWLKEYGPLAIFGISLFAFLFSLWLIYVQAALLQAFCIWCLAHEVTITLLFIASGVRLRQLLVW